MLPHWLARELRTLFLSLCLWTILHSSVKLVWWLLPKWPLVVCVNPIDSVCFVKDTVANASHSKRGMEKDFLITSDDPCFDFCFFFFFLYIFIPNYDFRFRNAIILLGEVIVFCVFCIYVYLYVCRLHCVTCLLGSWDCYDVSERQTLCFRVIYIKTWTFCHILTVANQTQHTMLCYYLEF